MSVGLGVLNTPSISGLCLFSSVAIFRIWPDCPVSLVVTCLACWITSVVGKQGSGTACVVFSSMTGRLRVLPSRLLRVSYWLLRWFTDVWRSG